METKELKNIDIATLQEKPEERKFDFSPKSFDDYLGQTELKNKLKIYTKAAKIRNEPLDHMLLFGPPGLGKTTLSQIMAKEMESGIRVCSGPMMERTGDLVAILSNLEYKDILFIDEIHRMPTTVEEVLYGAMEHFCVDIIIGQGAGAKSINLPVSPFTLIGATTKSGMISAPLRSRFGITERLDYYDNKDLEKIILQAANFLGIKISARSCFILAECSRGTPRIAKKLLRRMRDFSQVQNQELTDEKFIKRSLQHLGVDNDGLTKMDNLILEKMVKNFNGGPVGLDTIASMVGEDKDTIESVYEPFLLREGYIEKTSRGRQISSNKISGLRKKFLGQSAIPS